jgi:hypothetical protein
MQVEDANNETAGLLGLDASGHDCLWLLKANAAAYWIGVMTGFKRVV